MKDDQTLDYQTLDGKDPLSAYREAFHFPKTETGSDYLYFCGNSLGLLPKRSETIIQEELHKWKLHGVEGHFTAPRPWVSYHTELQNTFAQLVGALPTEVVGMNGLTVNLNLLMLSFYNPTADRFKIVIEKNAFPSDHYAVSSQVDLLLKKGVLTAHQAATSIVLIEPDEWGVYATSAILDTLNDPQVAMLLLSGVNYQTGQCFELERITAKCTALQITCGLDLAHAIGNVALELHRWQVDFAVWCTYKYLNGGPGSVGGAFVHQKNCTADLPRLHGWWSNREENRFEMNAQIEPYQTAEAWQMSNAPVLSMAALIGSLSLFDEVELDTYFQKGQALSDYLVALFGKELPEVQIITPLHAKGCQVSVFIDGQDKSFIQKLNQQGVIADWRNHQKGGILRLAPVPFYNSFQDCYRLVEVLKKII